MSSHRTFVKAHAQPTRQQTALNRSVRAAKSKRASLVHTKRLGPASNGIWAEVFPGGSAHVPPMSIPSSLDRGHLHIFGLFPPREAIGNPDPLDNRTSRRLGLAIGDLNFVWNDVCPYAPTSLNEVVKLDKLDRVLTKHPEYGIAALKRTLAVAQVATKSQSSLLVYVTGVTCRHVWKRSVDAVQPFKSVIHVAGIPGLAICTTKTNDLVFVIFGIHPSAPWTGRGNGRAVEAFNDLTGVLGALKELEPVRMTLEPPDLTKAVMGQVAESTALNAANQAAVKVQLGIEGDWPEELATCRKVRYNSKTVVANLNDLCAATNSDKALQREFLAANGTSTRIAKAGFVKQVYKVLRVDMALPADRMMIAVRAGVGNRITDTRYVQSVAQLLNIADFTPDQLCTMLCRIGKHVQTPRYIPALKSMMTRWQLTVEQTTTLAAGLGHLIMDAEYMTALQRVTTAFKLTPAQLVTVSASVGKHIKEEGYIAALKALSSKYQLTIDQTTTLAAGLGHLILDAEYITALQNLVTSLKLTPAQITTVAARVGKYIKEEGYTAALKALSSKYQLDLDQTTTIAAGLGKLIMDDDYLTALQRLVTSFKLAPAQLVTVAARVGKYIKQEGYTTALKALSGKYKLNLDQTTTIAAGLGKLIMDDDYMTALHQLVTTFKLTPAQATTVAARVGKHMKEEGYIAALKALSSKYQLTIDQTTTLAAGIGKYILDDNYLTALQRLVKTFTLTPAQATTVAARVGKCIKDKDYVDALEVLSSKYQLTVAQTTTIAAGLGKNLLSTSAMTELHVVVHKYNLTAAQLVTMNGTTNVIRALATGYATTVFDYFLDELKLTIPQLVTVSKVITKSNCKCQPAHATIKRAVNVCRDRFDLDTADIASILPVLMTKKRVFDQKFMNRLAATMQLLGITNADLINHVGVIGHLGDSDRVVNWVQTNLIKKHGFTAVQVRQCLTQASIASRINRGLGDEIDGWISVCKDELKLQNNDEIVLVMSGVGTAHVSGATGDLLKLQSELGLSTTELATIAPGIATRIGDPSWYETIVKFYGSSEMPKVDFTKLMRHGGIAKRIEEPEFRARFARLSIAHNIPMALWHKIFNHSTAKRFTEPIFEEAIRVLTTEFDVDVMDLPEVMSARFTQSLDAGDDVLTLIKAAAKSPTQDVMKQLQRLGVLAEAKQIIGL